jgi:hypothetical protein
MVAAAVGEVFAFMAGGKWVPCQIIGEREPGWEVVVFDVVSAKPPGDAAVIDGAPLYVLRRGRPRNQPLYLVCGGEPPAIYQPLGIRRVQLAFQLPTSFKTSPSSLWEDKLPSSATWTYAIGRVEDDLRRQPPPFRSKLFPGWTSVDARALRAIDAAVKRFASVKPATETALRKCVVATNKHEGEIQTTEAEELFEKLLAVAARNKLPRDRASAVIEATREW